MTFAWQAARGAVVVAILGAVFLLLPSASSIEDIDTTPLTIPDEIWLPLLAVLHLNRYLPISALLVVATLSLGIMAGMAMLGLVSWIVKHVIG